MDGARPPLHSPALDRLRPHHPRPHRCCRRFDARRLVENAAEAVIRTAIVHDYITQLGGAERVAGLLARRYQDAGLYTSVHRRDLIPLDAVGGRDWHTSFLQPIVKRTGLKATLPLLPAAVAGLPVGDYDLVISSSSAFGHHVRRGADALHVCLCHTPPRFLWQSDVYFRGKPGLKLALTPLLAALRRLDRRAARGVDAYVAVSKHVAGRIRETYGRDADVVYPPVDVGSFAPQRERSGRFLVVSRLVPSKRVELAIEAANLAALPLDVIGRGPELKALSRLAGPTVRMLGWQPDTEVRQAIARCEALVVAGEEDFGLVMVEAQASGRQPVAYAGGGALEIIEDGTT
ncbi:MAG TPA: glycosyltransferase, partial [Dehalococcoidia bacterium]|nr:glycosyltransferase [Dehalococcoidia bacterium]